MFISDELLAEALRARFEEAWRLKPAPADEIRLPSAGKAGSQSLPPGRSPSQSIDTEWGPGDRNAHDPYSHHLAVPAIVPI